jgi:hypothetical protein
MSSIRIVEPRERPVRVATVGIDLTGESPSGCGARSTLPQRAQVRSCGSRVVAELVLNQYSRLPLGHAANHHHPCETLALERRHDISERVGGAGNE